ncbi:hypothetical protein FQV27_15940 [Paracoccus aurantiacus]|uniref:DUF5666 domain-containing protein n=1 Tax=Paracoccus aurantiacus TaxID=2599412 RepID=A0A5C6RYF8_9RHOB|nr:DUF6152 family protein [Paracoccus aurantiacus]TXB66402.1 hypothetical protein FQV27_15940 [Paracoccus aurantiacus]
MNPLRRLLAVTAATLALSLPALAHHGWGWAEGELTELTGTIRSVAITPPHPVLQVETADGKMWTVQLGNPGRTERAGFIEGVASAGDEVHVLGNQSQDQDETLMKAVRIRLDGRDYTFYPERIPES